MGHKKCPERRLRTVRMLTSRGAPAIASRMNIRTTIVPYSDPRYRYVRGELPTRDPLPVSKDSFARIVSQADREFMGSQLKRQPDEPFYHYAREGGMTGMLETESIWATDYRFLNDTTELTLGEQAIENEIAAVTREQPLTTPLGWFCRHIEENRKGRRLI